MTIVTRSSNSGTTTTSATSGAPASPGPPAEPASPTQPTKPATPATTSESKHPTTSHAAVGDNRLLRGFPAKSFTPVRAENTTLWDAAGRTMLDFGGASHGVALLGHNHPDVVATLRDQATRLLHVAQGIPSHERARFLDALHARLPPSLTRSFIANSGTEAVECALKLASLGGRENFVAATNSFHGRTTASLSVTHRATFRTPFNSILPDAQFVPFNDIEALKATVNATTAAVILEPVQGEGGVQPATAEYLRAARDIASDHGAMLVFDEVQSGLCRTGSFLASQRIAPNVVPDAVTLAKGLAGGLPIGTCSVTEEIARRLPPGGHGSTYGGAPLACAVGATVLTVLDRDHLAERALHVGQQMHATIEGWQHPLVRAVRSAGMMIGVELRVRPQPVLDALQRAGILALGGGTTGLRFLPPLTVPEAQVQQALSALRAALDQDVKA